MTEWETSIAGSNIYQCLQKGLQIGSPTYDHVDVILNNFRDGRCSKNRDGGHKTSKITITGTWPCKKCVYPSPELGRIDDFLVHHRVLSTPPNISEK